jgi:hypothetical protein
MSVIAATHTVVNRKPRSPRHRFGQGILPPAKVEPYTQADLDWAAEALNASSEVYVVAGINHDALDQRAAEAAWYDCYAVDVRKGLGVSLDLAEEAALFGCTAPEDDDTPFPTLEEMDDYSRYQAAYSRFLDGRGPHPDAI